jgi:DNA-binding GntR family transcriptional regulator
MADAVAARDFDRFYAANLAFHDVYLSRSDNRRLVAQVHLLKQRLYDWPRRRGMLQAWEAHSVVEHEEFVALLERGAIADAPRTCATSTGRTACRNPSSAYLLAAQAPGA